MMMLLEITGDVIGSDDCSTGEVSGSMGDMEG